MPNVDSLTSFLGPVASRTVMSQCQWLCQTRAQSQFSPSALLLGVGVLFWGGIEGSWSSSPPNTAFSDADSKHGSWCRKKKSISSQIIVQNNQNPSEYLYLYLYQNSLMWMQRNILLDLYDKHFRNYFHDGNRTKCARIY